MKKHLILTMFLLMFALSLTSIGAVPYFNESSQTYATNTSEYTLNRNFGFQINAWNKTDGASSSNTTPSIENLTFELTHVMTGTATNYTNYTTIALRNHTASTFYINFTQEQLGRACNATNCYKINWYVNDTGGTQNLSFPTAEQWCLNKSNPVGFYNMSRREYPTGTGTAYLVDSSGANLSYSSPISQNITGWYSTTYFTGQTITFTLYKDEISQGTSNPQAKTVDYTDQTDTFQYNTTGNVNYSVGQKYFTITYLGGGGGGGGGTGPPPTNIPCPYECCIDDGQHIDKMCPDGDCVNHNCIIGTTVYVPPVIVTTLPGFELPILGEVEIGLNVKFLGILLVVFIIVIMVIYILYSLV